MEERRDGEGVTEEFTYSQAERCTEHAMHRIIPSERDADRFIAVTGGRLAKVGCPRSRGWHLVPIADLARTN